MAENRTAAEKKQDEKNKMDDLKKEVSMDEHMIDVKTLTARLKTDVDKVRIQTQSSSSSTTSYTNNKQ
jgi:hypothetical protein